MKYFAQSTTADVPANELTSEKAWDEYVRHAGGGNQRLVARPNFNKGTEIQCKFYKVWGENISNRQLFKRKLEGTIEQEVFEK